MLPWAIRQTDGWETLCNGSAATDERWRVRPSSGSTLPSSGTVRIDPLFEADEPARAGGASVIFEPGARTAWHTHPLGQTLIITSGSGRVQREGGPVEEVHPGDVVCFAPGEKHWHGASPTTAMSHIAIDESLQTMGFDYIDMMIIHSPQPWADFRDEDRYFEGNREAWRALEEAYKAGKLRAIGLSNFEEADVENILKSCSVKPMVNQILAHISNTPQELIQYIQGNGILVDACSPIGHGELLKNEEVAEIAEKYGVAIPQLGIRYLLQLGLLPLPKTANTEHMKENADVEFVISEEDMDVLKNVEPIEDYGSASRFPVFGGELNQ